MESENENKSVCVFDSGIGGLNLLYECVRRLPCVDFTYFSDNERVPYGRLTHSELIETADKIFIRISEEEPAAVVVACNTVTAHCIDFLRKKYPFQIIGIQPAIKPATAVAGNCLVLATPSTAESSSFNLLKEKYGKGRTVIAPCPDLAAFIENHISCLTDEDIIRHLPKIKADSVVLGCTHYVFAKDIIKNFYNCPVFDGISGTADHLAEILGIFDHRVPRAQKVSFKSGDIAKNRTIFHDLIRGGMEINP